MCLFLMVRSHLPNEISDKSKVCNLSPFVELGNSGHGQGTEGPLSEVVGASDLPSNEDDDEQGAEEDELESKRRCAILGLFWFG